MTAVGARARCERSRDCSLLRPLLGAVVVIAAMLSVGSCGGSAGPNEATPAQVKHMLAADLADAYSSEDVTCNSRGGGRYVCTIVSGDSGLSGTVSVRLGKDGCWNHVGVTGGLEDVDIGVCLPEQNPGDKYIKPPKH